MAFLVPVADVTNVSLKSTLSRLSPPERHVRRLLGAVPGVTPLESDRESDAEGPQSAGTGSGDADRTTAAAPSVSQADAAARATESGGTNGDADAGSTSRNWSPWPGAPSPDGDEEEDGGLDPKSVLAGAGAVLGLGLLAAVVYLVVRWWRGRSDGDGGGTGGDGSGGGPAGRAEAAADRAESERLAAEDARREAEEARREAEERERSPPIEASPLVGMAFLALAAGALRRVRSSSGGDGSEN